ncbi:3-oxoacyl-[acyl-carrier-protein] reductase [Allohahella marinimesophila]|uniref:3-oxoacyl-[acyl-carrier-protein] reductase n=1 Tax=Allohahella marinimesophila TaxID=1054972 RepID=A0ABP7NUN4_9GAMM
MDLSNERDDKASGASQAKRTVVLITGASRGIGKAILQQFCAMDAYVIGTATSQAGLEKIAQTIDENGGIGQAMLLDLKAEASVPALVENLKQQSIPVDVLVNNAGVTDDQLALAMKPFQWSRVIDTNLNGTFRLTQSLLRPMLRKKQGRIINISSVVASSGNAGQCNYAASKAALEAMTRSLALELARKHITVNAVAPGFIATDMTEELSAEAKAALLAKIPLGTMGAPEDIAACVTFLAGDSARYITGQVLHVNGGLYM